jgi:hypothetical protein
LAFTCKHPIHSIETSGSWPRETGSPSSACVSL